MMRLGLILAAALGVASCDSPLAYDLGKAEQPCHAERYAQKSALVECLAERERPVWQRDEPQTLDLFDQYAAQRGAIAKERDAGTLTDDQYEKRLSDLAREFRARVTDRRAAAE
jgi:hypothetical protein